METIYERLDLNKTRAAARKHLRMLGKKVMHQEIMAYINYTSSVISGIGDMHDDSDKVLGAMDQMSRDQDEVKDYVQQVVGCLNKLESDHRDVLLGKYLYHWDQEEMEKYLKKSFSSIRRLIRDAEVDFAILLSCEVMKG